MAETHRDRYVAALKAAQLQCCRVLKTIGLICLFPKICTNTAAMKSVASEMNTNKTVKDLRYLQAEIQSSDLTTNNI